MTSFAAKRSSTAVSNGRRQLHVFIFRQFDVNGWPGFGVHTICRQLARRVHCSCTVGALCLGNSGKCHHRGGVDMEKVESPARHPAVHWITLAGRTCADVEFRMGECTLLCGEQLEMRSDLLPSSVLHPDGCYSSIDLYSGCSLGGTVSISVEIHLVKLIDELCQCKTLMLTLI